jgi:hypothetical protein
MILADHGAAGHRWTGGEHLVASRVRGPWSLLATIAGSPARLRTWASTRIPCCSATSIAIQSNHNRRRQRKQFTESTGCVRGRS